MLGKIAEIRGMPSPQPSPTGEGEGCSGFRRCRSSEKECPKYQQREFFRHPLSQGRWNKRRERFFQTVFEPIGRVCAARHACGGLWLQRKWRTRACVPHTPYMWATAFLDLSLIEGRLKRKKQPAQPVFLAEPLTLTVTPSSLPWERVRERATSRKACIGAVRVLGKIVAIRGMPSPQLSPTGEGAGYSRFKRCRSSEKECPKHQRQEFFR